MDDERGKPLDFIEPFGDHLYIFMDVRGGVSKLIVTQNYQQITEVGTVVALGEKAAEDFAVGDRIMISYNTGIHIQIKESYTTSKYHRIVRTYEILTKISQKKRDAFNKE